MTCDLKKRFKDAIMTCDLKKLFKDAIMTCDFKKLFKDAITSPGLSVDGCVKMTFNMFLHLNIFQINLSLN